MRIEWFGQSAFCIRGAEATVMIDPFGDMSGLAARGMHFDYPAIEGIEPDLLLVTHEHGDHNGVEAIGGDPVVLRSTAGTLASPIGDVVAVASEHDEAAGTQRGPNTIFVFELDGVRLAHFGDFGQAALRPEQAAAIGSVDLAIVPVGGGPTIGAKGALEIATEIGAKWVVPMHYRTPRIGFLDTEEEFAKLIGNVVRMDSPVIDVDALPAEGMTGVIAATP